MKRLSHLFLVVAYTVDDCNADNIFNLFLASCLECVADRKKEGSYMRKGEKRCNKERAREYGWRVIRGRVGEREIERKRARGNREKEREKERVGCIEEER